MKRVVGIIGTLAVHALVVLILLWVPLGKGGGGGAGGSPVPYVTVRLIPKVTSPDAPVPIKGDDAGIKGRTAKERICNDKDKNYEGIGVIYSEIGWVVLEAPESYPAYRAGIRVDDILLNVRPKPENGYVTYHILRGKDQLTFRIKTEKICFEHKGPSNDDGD